MLPYCGTEYVKINDEREIANVLYFKKKFKERNALSLYHAKVRAGATLAL